MGEAAGETLYGVLTAQRGELIASWSERLRGKIVTAALPRAELVDHIPAFVDEITRALYPDAVPLPPMSSHAEEHGEQRLRLGFDVAEVVREYGALHECILEIASAAGLVISPREQVVVAKFLNAGIADAVSQYVRHRDLEMQRQTSEHLGFIAHELRNPLGAAQLAFRRLRGEVKESRTVEILDRNLKQTAEMIDSVLSHTSLKMGIEPQLTSISLDAFLREIQVDAAIEAQGRKITTVVSVAPGLKMEADPRLLRSAVSNLLQNALKFSHEDSTVSVTAARADGRVTIEVVDACGGLPTGKAAELFSPLVQRSENRSGFGFGLAIALQAAKAHNGTIRVRDMPGLGCAFVIDLPSIES